MGSLSVTSLIPVCLTAAITLSWNPFLILYRNNALAVQAPVMTSHRRQPGVVSGDLRLFQLGSNDREPRVCDRPDALNTVAGPSIR